MPINSSNAARLRGRKIAAIAPTDGQVLTYDTTNGWQPETPAGGGGEIQVVAHAGDGVPSNSSVFGVDGSGTFAVVQMADGATRGWIVTFLVPKGADGLGISKIEAFYKNRAASALNIFHVWETRYWAKTGGAVTADTTDSGTLTASPTTAGHIGILTAPTGSYNGLPATFNAGDYISVFFYRFGAEATDTYGQQLDVLSIAITFA